MPVIVFAIHDKKILVATGGSWYADGKTDTEKEAIAKAQRSSAATAVVATAEILTRLPKDTQMKPVEQRTPKGKPAYFTTRFVNKSDPHPPGFIKGTFPDKEHHPNEKPKEAAVREFEEETFTRIPIGRFTEVSLGTGVYKVILTDAEARDVITNWKTNHAANIGELVDLKWMLIATLLADVASGKLKLNSESNAAVRYLEKLKLGGLRGVRVFSGGQNKMVKTRSMTRRATRRAKSHCVGIKRSAVCKRTQGCKQAAGPKRRFCRTAKNRKHSK
jgi:hypothetical protein